NGSLLAWAGAAVLPLAFHTDETLNPKMLALEDLAERVLATGFPHPVAASHCVSLSLQTEQRQREVAEKGAAAGIRVIALPHTQLFLQGRDNKVAMPRAVAAVRALRSAGVTIAAGADNLQDPFNPVGRADPLETAGLMIIAAHVLPAHALDMVTDAARTVMGFTPTPDQVAVRAERVREAIAFGPTDRVVVQCGVSSVTQR